LGCQWQAFLRGCLQNLFTRGMARGRGHSIGSIGLSHTVANAPAAFLRRTGTEGKELWLTETGWKTADISEEAQADSYAQVLEGIAGYE
jgi:hypothetical protein